MKKLLIVDGNSILNRAFYGIRSLTTKDGLPTNAVYGFITILTKHLEALKPDYAVCAFDLKAPTFRHLDYELYKANRKPMPDELAVQLPYIKEAAAAMGFYIAECEGFEADDIIGTVCNMGDNAGDVHSYALTGDRDSLQLITENTSVILAKTKEDVVYTPEKFKEDYHVTPLEYIDVKALMGDSSDNIPGVKGIGEKTAFKLIEDNHSLDNIYGNIDAVEVGKSAKEKLIAGKDDAYKSKFLATIVKNAPVGDSLELFRTEGYDTEKLPKLLLRLEFSAIYKRLGFSESAKTVNVQTEETAEFDIPEFEDGIPADTDGVFSLFIKDGTAFVLGEKGYKFELAADAKSFFENNRTVCHNYKAVKKILKKYGIRAKCIFDTMLSAYLLNPGNTSYPFDGIAFSYLKRQLGDSGEECAAALKKLYRILSEKLEAEGMTKVLTDIELPLSDVLSDMEDEGMKLDCDGLRIFNEQMKAARDVLASQIYAEAGHEFNINSPKQLGIVLFEELKLPVVKKTKSGYSTNVDVLNALKPYHDIASDVLEYRALAKLISTYGEVLPTLADENGRVHTTFNQTGTATGRLSSTDPNLQNIPVRGEIGREIRKYFVADDGKVLIDADYSQIELRVLAESSGDENMQNAFLSGKDIHTSTAAQVFGVSELMVDSELRRRAKAVNFGIVYGIGAFSLSQDLGITRKQASEYIEGYLRTYPLVDRYLKDTVSNAKNNGYTLTAFGRKRPIPELSASNKNVQAFGERVAMNSPIQGTAADIIKIAMINVSKALEKSGIDAKLIMQVHDELIVEAAENDAEKAAEILKHEMESTIKTTVPMVAEVSEGRNWYEAK